MSKLTSILQLFILICITISCDCPQSETTYREDHPFTYLMIMCLYISPPLFGLLFLNYKIRSNRMKIIKSCWSLIIMFLMGISLILNIIGTFAAHVCMNTTDLGFENEISGFSFIYFTGMFIQFFVFFIYYCLATNVLPTQHQK